MAKSTPKTCALLQKLSDSEFIFAAIGVLAGDKTIGATRRQILLEAQRRYYAGK